MTSAGRPRDTTVDTRTLRGWIDDVRSARLPRRAFIARLAALGVSAPMASLLLADQCLAQTEALPYRPTRRGGGGALKLLMWQGPTLLNPHFASGSKDQDGCRPFLEPLVRYGADGAMEPVLAAEIPSRQNGGLAADGRWTLWKLKKGVTWHDGKPFSADDVIFNWQFATDATAGTYTSGIFDQVKTVEKVDPHTVRVVFARPTPQWAIGASLLLIPKHLFDAYKGPRAREAPGNLKPVGTGPYRFVDFKPGDLVRGELNPTYHLPNRPHFDTIEIKGGGDATSAARAVLQTGEYDYAWNLLVEDEVLKRMEAVGKGRVIFSPSGTTEYIQLNAADPWTETDGEKSHPRSRHAVLSDPAVRQALRLLTDRRAIQDVVYGRTGVATPNILNNPAPYNSPNQKLETSLDKANSLLDGAGWKRGSDGKREKNGRKLQFVFQTSINSVRQKVQAIVKQSWGRAGIDVELKTVTAAVFFSSDVGNPDTFGKFGADVQMYAFTREPDPGRFMQSYVSWEASSKANKWQGMNRGRWVNEEYDRLFKASETELDPVKRAALFIRMNDLVCNDVHVIPIAIRPDVAAIGRTMVAPTTGWDVRLSAIHDWYRES